MTTTLARRRVTRAIIMIGALAVLKFFRYGALGYDHRTDGTGDGG